MNRGRRFDFISKEAHRLGSDSVGFVPSELWDSRAFGCLTPCEIWPAARLVVVLAIATMGYEGRTEEYSILNGMAYRLAVWLCDDGIASVFLPCGENDGKVFPHGLAAMLAGLSKCGFADIRSVSVLTSYGDD